VLILRHLKTHIVNVPKHIFGRILLNIYPRENVFIKSYKGS